MTVAVAHCPRCGDQTSKDSPYCSDACARADQLDYAYDPIDNDRHGTSTTFNRDDD